MTLLEILKIVAVIATILTGVVSLFWPLRVRGFTGLFAGTMDRRAGILGRLPAMECDGFGGLRIGVAGVGPQDPASR